MTPQLAAALKTKMRAYRSFAADKFFISCRLVHYCGVDKPNAVDVTLDQIEDQISACVCEGLFVDWFCEGDRLYLCVQEPGCPIPERSKIVAEEAIEDVDEIIRKAGLDP